MPDKETLFAGRCFTPGDSFESIKAEMASFLIQKGCDPFSVRYSHCEEVEDLGSRHIWLADKYA